MNKRKYTDALKAITIILVLLTASTSQASLATVDCPADDFEFNSDEYQLPPSLAQPVDVLPVPFESEAPIVDPNVEQVLVFVVRPGYRDHRQVRVVPVNHDLLESFAKANGYELGQFRTVDSADLKVETILDIRRFNDPLRERSLKVHLTRSKSSAERQGGPTALPLWQSTDGKRIASKLRHLSCDRVIVTIPAVSVSRGMLIESTKHAHFAKVPTRSNAFEANPGNPAPDTQNFLPSDRNTTSH